MQKARHFAKSTTICVKFLFKKIQTIYFTRFFMKSVKFTFIYIQKALHFALHDVFIYKKPDTSKIAKNIASHFLYAKSLTLCVT